VKHQQQARVLAALSNGQTCIVGDDVSVRLSAPYLRFTQNRNDVETSNLLDNQCKTRVTLAGLMTEWLSGTNSEKPALTINKRQRRSKCGIAYEDIISNYPGGPHAVAAIWPCICLFDAATGDRQIIYVKHLKFLREL